VGSGRYLVSLDLGDFLFDLLVGCDGWQVYRLATLSITDGKGEA
jgi:hypothetical protein